jgi:poly(3-hydroxyalkanoate) synthetase
LKKFVQVIPPSAKAGLDAEQTRLQNEKLKKEIANVEAGGEFKPTNEQKALVGRFLNTAEGKALYQGQTLTSSDINAINSDPALFYAVLQKANEAGIY